MDVDTTDAQDCDDKEISFEYQKMRISVSEDDIEYPLAVSPWDLGNQTLYSLCQDHPMHDRDDVIIAKVWLIGRSYAAAVERRNMLRQSNIAIYFDKNKKSN